MKMTCWVFFTLLILYHFLRFMPFYAFFMAVAIGFQGSPILICLWLGSPHFRMAFVLLSTAFVAVVLLVLYRAYKPSKTYGIFLSHHKLGAAVQLDKIDGKIAHKLTALVKWINSKTKCRCVEVLGLSAIIWSVDKSSSIYQLYVDEPYPSYNQVG